MTREPAAALLTADDLFGLPDDGCQYELEAGRLLRMPSSGLKASVVAATVVYLLAAWVRPRRLGAVGGADLGFLIARNPDTVRAADAVFYRAERISESGIPSRYWDLAPDLAVEVLSPSNRPGAILRKVGEYLDAGTALVWMLDPEQRRTTVFRAGGSITVLGEDGVLDGEDVLPGCAIALSEVWV